MATVLRKATEMPDIQTRSYEEILKVLMPGPLDYSQKAIFNKTTRNLIEKVTVEHGGKTYDEQYPDGIPTSVVITLNGHLIYFKNH